MGHNILIINAGSTSLKFSIFEKQEDFQLLHSGQFDQIEADLFTMEIDGEKRKIGLDDYQYCIWRIREELFPDYEFEVIGFRVVHGGEAFKQPTMLTPEVVNEIDKLSILAPLHNPPAVDKIRQAMDAYPETPKYAVFDTEFHTTIPEKAYLYALPYKFYKENKVRRYGFHGISHEYLYTKLLEIHNPRNPFSRVITCHLGGGASITAIKDGKSVDTSMGFTPMEGLVMSTRAGDVDDGVQNFLEEKLGYSEEEINRIYNEESGLLGLSEETSDMIKLIELYKINNANAIRSLDVYIYKIQKYIGSYIAAMNGVDALVFGGGVGSGSDFIRKKICENMDVFGIEVDDMKNDGQINVENSLEIGKGNVKIYAINTDEELMIAKKIAENLS